MTQSPIEQAIAVLEYYSANHERHIDGTENQCASHQFAPRAGEALTALRQHREWLPIESAPRDGTNILIFYDGYIGVAQFLYEEHGASFWSDLETSAVAATHWQPLPPPPQKENE